jgi:PAS domain S-box-containing protein
MGISFLSIRAARAAFLILITANAALFFRSPLYALGVEEPRRILILYSFDKEEGIYAPLDQALRSDLKSQVGERVEFYAEYLDLVRFPDPKHAETLVKLLKLKLAEKKPDLIIPVSYSALKFLLEDGKDLFPGVPIVALFNERRTEAVTAAIEKLPSRPQITGVEGRDDPRGTLDLALRLQPDTNRVVVIVGSSPFEKFWLQQLQSDFAAYSGRIEFDYLTDLPMSEMLKRLAGLPPHSIILYGFFFQDSTGQSFLPEEALDLIASAANAPVYGNYLTYLDHGVAGGKMEDPEQTGAAVAGLAARVLKGERAAAIPMIVDPSLSDTVDWRQLRRWRIDEKRVPAGTRILHKELSPWQRYRQYFRIAISLFAAEAALILGLLLETIRRRRAEKRLLREKTFSDALIEAMPGALTVLDEDLKNVRWNKNAEKLVRFPINSGPLVNIADNSKELVRQTLRELADESTGEGEIEILSKEERPIPFYFNVRRVKLGEKRYFIAAGIDISGRKRAEDKLRLSESRFASAFEHAPNGMALTGMDGRYLRVNRALCNLLGYSAEELHKKSWLEVTHPDDLEADQECFRQMLAGEVESYQLREKRYRHKSGRIVWTFVSLSLVRDKEGQPAYFIAQVQDISERKLAEQKLRVSEERFSSAFEHAPIGIALSALDGRYLRVNQALCDMLGYTAEELQTRTWQELTHPEDVETDWEQSRHILAGGPSVYRMREKRYFSKSGKIVWASVSVSLVRNKLGQPDYFIVQIQDITEQKQLEEAIRGIVEGVHAETSADFFASMALQLSKATHADHTFIAKLIDEDESAVTSLGRCVSRAIAENITYKLAGTPCAEVRNKGVCSYSSGVADLFPDDPKLREMGVQGYAGVPLYDSQKRLLGIMVAMFNAPLANPRFVESLLQVFSKWTAAEIERSQAEERFTKAFQSSPEGCAIATLQEGRFIDANEAFFQMTGYSRAEVIGDTSAGLRIWNDPEERSALIQKLAETGRAREEAVKFRTKSGKILDIRMSAEVIYLQNEACLLGLARDVTEQNALEEQFRQAQKMEAMGRLAGGIAHDFNNLLGVIIGYSELLSATSTPNAPATKKIEAIKQAAQRAASLTAQLLAYSRRQPTQRHVLNVSTVVAENENMLRRLVGEDVRLVTIQDRSLGYVRADPNQIVQVIMNLAVNARDAMSDGGTLTIETVNVSVGEDSGLPVRPGAYVKLTVSDTGTGMDEPTKARIFEPFFTTKPPGQGTGLGLATVYGIVEQNDGAIFVDSKLGVGTTFEIYLPRVDQAAAPSMELPAETLASNSATILLVEDEVALRMVIDESLRSDGYKVMVAGNGLDALRIAEQHQGPIHLLITDVIMPAMSGPELARALAVSRPDTRVLYISGYTADRLTHYPKLDRDVFLLRKPFKLNDLAQKIHNLLTYSSQPRPSPAR